MPVTAMPGGGAIVPVLLQQLRRLRRHAAHALFLSLLAAAGCGGSDVSGPVDSKPPGGDPPGTNPGASLTVEERHVAIDAVEDRARELGQRELSREEFNEALAAWFGSRAEFEAAGVDEESSSVWARFTDGRLLVIANNRDPGAPSEAARDSTLPAPVSTVAPSATNLAARTEQGRASPWASPWASPSPRTMPSPFRGSTTPLLQAAAGGQATELPESKKARILHSFGSDFEQVQAPVDDLAGWLEDAGYEIDRGKEGDASVEVLRNVSGDGVFYLNTHGGTGETRTGQKVYIIQSSTLKNKELEKSDIYQEDLDNGRLVYMTAKNGGKILGGLIDDWDTRYAITYHFVEKYMSFGKNGLVFMNACFSGNPHSDISSFSFAMHKKGAGVYVGWTKSVGPDAAFTGARYMFDRLLGGNRYKPEDPAQRPFDWSLVLEDMNKKGLTVDRGTGAELVAKPASLNAPAMGVLAPSIYAVSNLFDVDEGRAQLGISGIFGMDPGPAGQVTISGPGGEVALAVISWEPTFILADLPSTGPGSAGDVVVTVRGHKSNPRQLLRWQGPVTYTYLDGGTLTLRLDMELDVRLDPDLARKKPGEAPEPHPLAFQHALVDGPPLGTWNASGQFVDSYGDCTATTTWSGSGSLDSDIAAGRIWSFNTRLDFDQRRFDIDLFGGGGEFPMRMVVKCPTTTDTHESTIPIRVVSEVFDNGGSRFSPYLGNAMEIQPERRVKSTHSQAGANAPATARFEWQTIRPVPAFDPKKPK